MTTEMTGGMPSESKVKPVFESLSALGSVEQRRNFFLAHPVLFGKTSLEAIAGEAGSSPQAERAYAELIEFAASIREKPGSYPLGTGPVEALLLKVMTGVLRMDLAVSMAREADFSFLLCEEYVLSLGQFAASKAVQGQWRQAFQLNQILLAAVRQDTWAEFPEIRIAAEKEWLVAAGAILIHIADGNTFDDALDSGEWLLKTALERKDQALQAWAFYYLGLMHLDPLTAFGSVQNYPSEFARWLRRGAEELGPEAVETLPGPEETVNAAEIYLRKAAALATGEYRANSLKALLQALEWKQAMGGTVDESEIRQVAWEALTALDPMNEPNRWLRIASRLDGMGVEYDRTLAGPLLKLSIDECIARWGAQMAAATVTAILILQRRRNPWEALQRSSSAASLFASLPRESERIEFLNIQLLLMKQATIPKESDGRNLRAVVKDVLAWTIDVERIGAALVGLAGETSKINEEVLGLDLLDRARLASPELLKRYAQAVAFQEGLLWLGIASNNIKPESVDLDRAVQAYGRSMEIFLKEGLVDLVQEILRRLHDLATRRDPDSSVSLLLVLIKLGLRVEIAGGEPAADLVRSICQELTVAMVESEGGALLPVIWQVAKGMRWSTTLSVGFPASPGEDPKVKLIIADLESTRQGLPQSDLNDPRPVSGSPLFEAWLTSYIRSERFNGDEPWERIANLKITLDERVQQLLIPQGGDTGWSPWQLTEIQESLDAETVLLMVYLGIGSGGRPTSYGLLITRDDIRAHGCASEFKGSELQFTDHGRTAEFSAFAVKVQALRLQVQLEPGAGAISPEGQENLSGALSFYFGALEADLAEFRAAGKTHLLVSPHDALHFAPFHLFGASPLADAWTVTYLPNLALLATPRGRIGRNRRRRWNQSASIGLGFLGAPGGWPEIPEATQEARAVAGIFGVDPILNEQATKETVLQTLSRSSAVHISTHGAMDVDAPSLQFLVVDPADDELAGRVSAHEILDFDLAGMDLVTLSACESALGRIDRSDNLRGFPAALFSAGVSTVIGTLWPANAEATLLFFTTFYREYQDGKSRLNAYRQAQSATRQAFPQHRDWGAFYLAGAWD